MSGCFLVEGERAAGYILDYAGADVLEVLISEEIQVNWSGPTRRLTEKQFRSISSRTTPTGVAAVVRIPADVYTNTLPSRNTGNILLLEDVQDPGNVGTLLRSAAAFGFTGAILSPGCADPFGPKTVQATAGSILSLWLRRTPDYLELARRLKGHPFTLCALDLRGDKRPEDLQREESTVLAIGNEARGISPALLQLADKRIYISIRRRQAESLNAAVSGAICIYLLRRTD